MLQRAAGCSIAEPGGNAVRQSEATDNISRPCGSVLQRAEEDAGVAEDGADQQPAASAANGTPATEVLAPHCCVNIAACTLDIFLAVSVMWQRFQSSM